MAFIPKKEYKHKTWQKKQDNSFYQTPAWRKVRSNYLKAYPLCVECKKLNIIEPATVVDHIKQIREGGEMYSYSNLQGLCRTHHAKKSGREGRTKQLKYGN